MKLSGESEVEWDSKKAASNLRKHGISFDEAKSQPKRKSHSESNSAENRSVRPDNSAYLDWLSAEVQEAIDDVAPTVSQEEAFRQIRSEVFGS